MIASVTKRTINERMEEDPVYYEKISRLIQKAIDDHKAQRISELEYLREVTAAREQVIRPKHDDVPERIRNNDTAVAFFHVLEKEAEELGGKGNNVAGNAAEAAERLYSIIDQHRVVNWIQREDIQNEMRNDIDDFLFDVVRDEMGVSLTVEKVDRIVDRILAIARVRMAS